MNIKLLKELYKQAETECGWSEEKFAELIVRECLAQVARVDDMLEDEPTQKAAVAWAGSAIAEHFGVEE